MANETAVPSCSRCGEEPRLPSQRWGRKCLAAHARLLAPRTPAYRGMTLTLRANKPTGLM